MTIFADSQSKSYARVAGVFYLSIAVFGGFALLWVPSQIFVSGDPLGTVENIQLRKNLFLAGMAAEGAIILAEIMLAAMLYFMFKPVSATLSFAAAFSRLSMVGVMAAMLFFSFGVLIISEASGSLGSFSEPQKAEMMVLLLEMHDAGVWIWQILFTLHLVILGQLIARSGTYPRVLGHAMTLGGFGYALDTINSVLVAETGTLGVVASLFLTIASLAEIGFALLLVFRGPRGGASNQE